MTILIIILAAGSIGSEFSWATVRTSLLMGATRMRFLAGKFLALVLVGFVWLVIANVIAFAGELITSAATNHAIPTDYLTSGSFASDVGLDPLPLANCHRGLDADRHCRHCDYWLACGWARSDARRSLLGSSIAGLIAQIGDVGRWVARVIPNRALDAIISLDSADPPSYLASDWIWIIASVVGWSLLIAILALRRFQRMNLVGGS